MAKKGWKKVTRKDRNLAAAAKKGTILDKLNKRIKSATKDMSAEQRIKWIQDVTSGRVNTSTIRYTDKGYISTKSRILNKQDEVDDLIKYIPTMSELRRRTAIVARGEQEKLSADEIRDAIRYMLREFFARYYEDYEELDLDKMKEVAETNGDYEFDADAVKKYMENVSEIGKYYREDENAYDFVKLIADANALRVKAKKSKGRLNNNTNINGSTNINGKTPF